MIAWKAELSPTGCSVVQNRSPSNDSVTEKYVFLATVPIWKKLSELSFVKIPKMDYIQILKRAWILTTGQNTLRILKFSLCLTSK